MFLFAVIDRRCKIPMMMFSGYHEIESFRQSART